MEPSEVKINVPWGLISCKIWGKQDNNQNLVVLIHALFDNAASFDRLIPFLPCKDYVYVSFDLPGHGKSSHLPVGTVYHQIDLLSSLRVVLKRFSKGVKSILIGHGLGAHLAIHYAQIYPRKVEKLILLDTISYFGIGPHEFKSYMHNHHALYFEMAKDNFKINEEYNYEQLISLVSKSREFRGMLCREAAENLLKRSAKQKVGSFPKTFELTTDQRLKNIMKILWGVDFTLDFLKKMPILCPTMVIISRKRPQHIWDVEKRALKIITRRGHADILNIMHNGDHDIHQNDPEKIAIYIIEFVNTSKINKSNL